VYIVIGQQVILMFDVVFVHLREYFVTGRRYHSNIVSRFTFVVMFVGQFLRHYSGVKSSFI